MPQAALPLTERQINVQVTWGLYLSRMPVAEIARRQKVTVEAVEFVIEHYKAIYQSRNRDLADEITKTQLATHDYVIGEAAVAWQASKSPTKQTTRGDVMMDPRTGNLLPKPDVIVTKQRHGDVVYLQIMMKAMAEQRKLLGLDAPDKHELTLLNDDARSSVQIKLEELAARSEFSEVDEPLLITHSDGEEASERAQMIEQVEVSRELKRAKKIVTLPDSVLASRTNVGIDLEPGMDDLGLD